MDWPQLVREIAFRGGADGLDKEQLFAVLEDMEAGDVARAKVLSRLCKFPEVQVLRGSAQDLDGIVLRLAPSAWDHVLLEGKAVRLSEQSRRALACIARAGADGINCPELGAAIKMDARNLHYHLSPLTRHSIILKIPITSKRTNTYLCVLSRFVAEEDAPGPQDPAVSSSMFRTKPEGGDQATGTALIKPSSTQLMGKITEVLASAPDRTLPSPDLFRLIGVAGMDKMVVRMYRRCLRRLVSNGSIEMLLARSIGGPRFPIYRFKSHCSAPQGDQLGAPSTAAASPRAAPSTWAPQLCPLVSLEKQARDLVAGSGSRGMLLSELRAALGISTKLAFRMHARLTERRFLANADIVKITEFCGKERRHRLFVEGASPNEPAPLQPSRPASAVASAASLPTSEADIPAPKTAAPPSSARTESITKHQRQQVFLDYLRKLDPPILDVGKSLGQVLGEAMAKLTGSPMRVIDNKTIKRMVGDLEKDGLIRTAMIVTEVPARLTRLLVMAPDVASDDPRLLALIQRLKDGSRIYDLTRGEEPSSVPAPPNAIAPPEPEMALTMDDVRKRLDFFGYVFGVMERLKLLHLHLCKTVGPGNSFDTPSVLFQRLPLLLLLQLVGLSAASSPLQAYLRDVQNRLTLIQDLPQPLRKELLKKRGTRMRACLRVLLNLLGDLGLVVAVDDIFMKRMKFYIPISFRLSPMGHLPRPPDGRTHRLLDFKSVQDAEQYWAMLQQTWTHQQGDHAGLLHVLQLASNPTNWLASRPVCRKLAHPSEITEREEQMVEELGVEREQAQRVIARTRPRALRKRPLESVTEIVVAEAPLLNSRKKAKPSKTASTTDLLTWSEEAHEDLRLVFVLLHDAPFVSYLGGNASHVGSSSGAVLRLNLNWTFANGLIAGKSNDEMRFYGIRHLLSDWSEMQKCLELEGKVNILRQVYRPQLAQILGPASEERALASRKDDAQNFKKYYDFMKDALTRFAETFHQVSTEHTDGDRCLKAWWVRPSMIMEDWERIKHSRVPIMDAFDALPFYQLAVPPPEAGTLYNEESLNPAILAAISDLKAVMTWPASTYNALEAGIVLARHLNPDLQTALRILLGLGFLSRASSGRHRYRIPGTNYALAWKIAMLLAPSSEPQAQLDAHEPAILTPTTVATLDFNELFDQLLSGDVIVGTSLESPETGLQVTLTRRAPATPTAGDGQRPVFGRMGLEQVNALASSAGCLVLRRIWTFPCRPSDSSNPLLNQVLLVNLLNTVKGLVEEAPGLGFNQLASNLWPLLSKDELDDLLRVLQTTGWVEVVGEGSERNFFPRIQLLQG